MQHAVTDHMLVALYQHQVQSEAAQQTSCCASLWYIQDMCLRELSWDELAKPSSRTSSAALR